LTEEKKEKDGLVVHVCTLLSLLSCKLLLRFGNAIFIDLCYFHVEDFVDFSKICFFVYLVPIVDDGCVGTGIV